MYDERSRKTISNARPVKPHESLLLHLPSQPDYLKNPSFDNEDLHEGEVTPNSDEQGNVTRNTARFTEVVLHFSLAHKFLATHS